MTELPDVDTFREPADIMARIIQEQDDLPDQESMRRRSNDPETRLSA